METLKEKLRRNSHGSLKSSTKVPISRGGTSFTMYVSWWFLGVEPPFLCQLILSRGGPLFTLTQIVSGAKERWYKAQKVKTYAVNSQLQIYQILTNDVQMLTYFVPLWFITTVSLWFPGVDPHLLFTKVDDFLIFSKYPIISKYLKWSVVYHMSFEI